MKAKITLLNFLLLISLLVALEVHASDIFVVSGKVLKADGSSAQDGLLVTAENTRTGVVGTGKTGKFGPGVYSATIFNPFKLELKTKAGDSLKITVKDGERTLGELGHVVTESEVRNLVAENIDIQIDGVLLSAEIKPTSLLGDGESQATIIATVADSIGQVVTDDTITIIPTLGKVGVVTNNGDGTYTAVYTAPSITKDKVDDVITVASTKLGADTTLSVMLLRRPPVMECDVALQIFPSKLTVSTDDEVSTANITVEVKCGGESVTDEVVEIEVIGMGTVEKVTNVGDGTYKAVYTAPETIGDYIIKATAKNSGVSTTIDITLIHDEPASIEVSANPDTLKPDGFSTSTLTAIVKDTNGNPVDDAKVTFSITSGNGSLGEVEHKGKGQHMAVYTAPDSDSESTVTITGEVDTPQGKKSDSTTIKLDQEGAELVVSGNVLEADGKTSIPDGINVNVIMVDNVTESTITKDGKYEVKFFKPPKDLKVSDRIRTTVTSADGIAIYGFSAIHELTETDLESKSLSLDVITNRTSIFTISGKVTKIDDVTPISSAIVSARGKRTVTSDNGSYALEFTDYDTNPIKGEEIPVSVSPKAGVEKEVVVQAELSEREMQVNISIDITPPEANAGDDIFIQPGATVFFDATKSTDNTQIARYSWDFNANDGIQEDATGAEIILTSDKEKYVYNDEGEYVVTLTVIDVQGNAGMDTLIVTVDGKAIIEPVPVEGSPANANGSIKVSVIGEPGGQARFSISGVEAAMNLLMTEAVSGQYVGEYDPQEGDDVVDATVTVNFTDKAGNEIDDTSQRVTIDTIPPRPSILEYPQFITQDNMTSVRISGKAEKNASVTVALEDETGKSLEQTASAGENGDFSVVFDASTLGNEGIDITVTESADAAGNESIPTKVSTTKTIADEPDFGLSSPQPNIVTSNRKADYIITIIGSNGFDKSVELAALRLPKGWEAEFNPEVINLTQDESSQTSQLTVTIPSDADVQEYSFKVVGFSEEVEKSHSIVLTLKIDTLTTFISLRAQPNPVKLDGQLKALGQLVIQGGMDEREDLEVKLSYKLPDGKVHEQIATAQKSAEDAYDYDAELYPDEMGDWEVTASFLGDNKLKPSSRTMSFQVEPRDSTISLTVPGETKILGDSAYISGRLEPNLKGVNMSLSILPPEMSASNITRIVTEEAGTFNYELQLDQPGAWEIKAKWEGNEQSNETTSETKVITVIKPIPKYIIVQGGGDEDENEDWEVFYGIVMDVYKTLTKRDFSDDDIYFLSPAKNPAEIVDAKTSRESLKYAITEWAKPQVSSRIPLYLYLLSHNIGDEFLLVKESGRKDFLTPNMLHEWLAPVQEETGAEVTITIEACYSGGFIKDKEGNETTLPQEDRTIMTSARNDVVSRAQKRHSFSYHLFSYIERDFSVKDAFDKTQEIMSKQSPWLDADGDGQHGEEADYAMLENVYIPYQLGTDFPDLPDIYDISGEQILTEGKKEAQIWALVSGAGITGVWALIAPPKALESDKPFESWEELTLPEIELFDHDGDGIYENTYGDFTKPGTYTITVLAENEGGYTGDPVQTTVTVVTKWDLNGDGAVDISDLIIVAKHLGEETGEETSEGDVNDDGKVDISDLSLMSSHFGE